jgi:hypothetical protein
MFVISPRLGLCNQLQTIVKGILLAIKYNRNIYIDKFQIDLTNKKLCNINCILDIEKINIFLQNTIKTHIKILNVIDYNIINNLYNYCLPNINYTEIPTMFYLNDNIELNKNMEIIYLGNIVSLNITDSFNYNYDDYSDNNLYYLIMVNIHFNETFYKIKNHIKQELNLSKFNCIHLRIEDDALKHFSMCYELSIEEYNDKLLNFYDNNIKTLVKNKIYICSGMLKFNNTINLKYYNNIMKNNNLLCDKKNINIDEYYLNNRELIAIIDLLIAYDSDIFVGCYISSFTQAIKHYFKYNKKECILFK